MTLSHRFILRAFGLVIVVFALGCGGSPKPPTYGSEEGKKIAVLVEDLNEARADGKQFKQLFSGSAPTDWKKYSSFLYDVEGHPTVNGDTATARVKIRADGDGSDKGSQEWTFVKAGDGWKIKTAALP